MYTTGATAPGIAPRALSSLADRATQGNDRARTGYRVEAGPESVEQPGVLSRDAADSGPALRVEATWPNPVNQGNDREFVGQTG